MNKGIPTILIVEKLMAWDKTTVPTSMREVESSVRLIMDKRKLSPSELKCSPWQHQKSESGESESGVNGEEA